MKKKAETISLDMLNVRRSLKLKFAAVIVVALLLNAPVSHFIVDLLERFEFMQGTFGVYINSVVNIGVVTLVLILLLNRMVVRPLNTLAEKLQQIAKGDLSVQVVYGSGDEIGRIYGEVEALKNSMREMIGHINRGAEQVAATSGSVKEMMQEALDSLQGISSAMQQVSASIQQVAADTQAMSSFSEQVSGAVDAGRQNMNGSVGHMDVIRDSVGKSASVVGQLDEQSRQINSIISVITGIAEQTNLLALNAAIEAARAGEHGRGFAVVADEVRELAEQSRKSAGEIVALVEQIGRKVNDSVEYIRDSEGSVARGADEIGRLEEVFGNISSTIEELGDRLQAIAGAVEEVSASTQQVSASSQKELSTIQEVNRMADEMTLTAADLREKARQFNL